MARIPRLVAPGLPHHVIQRGNRRQQIFFCQADYLKYMEILAEKCVRHEVEVQAYCLMPNHVHLIVIPRTEDGLRRAIGETHKQYTERINHREGWRGHLWQGRFSSYVLDTGYLAVTVRYISLNPVRARIVKSPEQYPWSSARFHKTGMDDPLVKADYLAEMTGGWETFIKGSISPRDLAAIKRHEKSGRPMGGPEFLEYLEKRLGWEVRPQKRGPMKKTVSTPKSKEANQDYA
jgi:putative transposase